MANSAQFDSALDRLSTALKDVFRELHAAASTGTPGAAPVAAAAPAGPPPGPGTAPLCSGFERIMAGANQTDIMQALLDGSEGYAGRSAILVVKGDSLAPWRWKGFDDAGVAGLRNLKAGAAGLIPL